MSLLRTAAVATAAIAIYAFGALPLRAGTLPNITGTWYAQGSASKRCHIRQSGSDVTLTNEIGTRATGVFTDPSTLSTSWPNWPNPSHAGPRSTYFGHISADLTVIHWSNGTYWTRSPQSATPAAIAPVPTANANALLTQGYVRLRNTFNGSGKCLDIVNDGWNNRLKMADCGNYSGQTWWATKTTQGYVRLRNTFNGSGKCLDIVNDGWNNRLTMATCGDYSGQRWWATETARGYVRLRNTFSGSGACLDIVNDGRNNRLTMANCGNYSGQRWWASNAAHE